MYFVKQNNCCYLERKRFIMRNLLLLLFQRINEVHGHTRMLSYELATTFRVMVLSHELLLVGNK